MSAIQSFVEAFTLSYNLIRESAVNHVTIEPGINNYSVQWSAGPYCFEEEAYIEYLVIDIHATGYTGNQDLYIVPIDVSVHVETNKGSLDLDGEAELYIVHYS